MNSFEYTSQPSEQQPNQSTSIQPGTHTSSSQQSPPYTLYTPSSPPWSPFPLVSPLIQPIPTPDNASGEVSSVSERNSGHSPDVFHFIPENEPVASEGLSTPSVSLSGPLNWHLPQSQQCMSMEDAVGLSQEMLEADVVFDESIQESEPSLDFQESSGRDVNVGETSGRDDYSALLIKFGPEPFIGLEFRSEGEAYEYYRAYAKENGFSIRKSHVERSRVDHSLISRKFVCVKQGFRSLKDKRYEGKVVRHRRVTRVDCRAAMIIKRRTGKWVVHRFHKEHNHDLGDPDNNCGLHSHRKMTNSTKSIVESLYKTQCIDEEDNALHCQKISEGNEVASDNNSILEPQPIIYVADSLNRDVNREDTSGMKDTNIKESPHGDVNVAEPSQRDNDASLIKLGSEPCIGLQFSSQEEAYEFYNAYAKEKGFSIRKSRIERSRIDHSMISRLYVCANQGVRSTKDKRYEGKVVRPRQETRLDCRAAMFIKRKSGKWVVDRFRREHNHDLVDPTKAEKLRSHRKMTMATKSMIEALYKCGVGPSKIVDLIKGVEGGGKDVLRNNGRKDILGNKGEVCEHNMKKERKNNIRVECYHLLDYFQEIQANDPGFFYAVEFDENRCMRSIFWVDGKAKDSYRQFGDVLVFDTICRTNKYLFPFASFTGVNHHRQSVLFGCGFLADETVESFVWFFKTWLRAMSNQQPTSIITNQDKSIKVAIEKVFPDSRHRFCMWHIEKDEIENLTHIFDMHTDFRAEYKSCIHNSWTPEEFELGWEALLVKYNLKDNKWLNRLFNHRHHWVPLYLRDTFFGGMTTTQRGESMNSYFHEFLHGGTPIGEFVSRYEQAVKHCRKEEAEEDFLTVFTSAVLTSKNPIEEQAARNFTRNMFTKFQNEFIESSGCTARNIGKEGPVTKYLVGKYKDKGDKMHLVTFDPTENIVSCSCQMFDSEGMLCRHVLKVFQAVDVFEIPPQYILKRWTMNNQCVDSTGEEAGVRSQDMNATTVWALKEKSKLFVELGEKSNEKINVAINILQEGMRKLSVFRVPPVSKQPDNLRCHSIQIKNVNECSESIWTVDLNTTASDPPRLKLKGRPVSSRVKLSTDQAQKKKRTCGTCKEAGQYTRTCPKGTVDQLQASEIFQGADHSQTSGLLHRAVDQIQSSTLAQSSILLQGPVGLCEASPKLQQSLDQSQTSMLLQEHFGQLKFLQCCKD